MKVPHEVADATERLRQALKSNYDFDYSFVVQVEGEVVASANSSVHGCTYPEREDANDT